MTIQVGINGPPNTVGTWLRVWTDRAGGAPTVRFADSGLPVPGLTVRDVPTPPQLDPPPALTRRRLFEIAGWPSDRQLVIELGGEVARVLTPPDEDGQLRLLIGSCFYWKSDKGKLLRAFRNLRPQIQPHIRIHAGDQVYLDAEQGGEAVGHLERTVRWYRKYWGDPSYGEFLRSGVSLFTPDDHDFWNDYPYSMPHLRRSWAPEWEAHSKAAQRALLAYQTLSNPNGAAYFELDLGLVSLFVTDTRSKRGDGKGRGPRQLFDQGQRDALRDWSRNLNKPGVLVSAMPVFQKPKGKAAFGLITTDHNLLAYEQDAAVIWRAVEEAPHDVVVVTGDIHQGRLNEWKTGAGGGERQRFELVASPLSILTWMSGRPKADGPPTVKVMGRTKRVGRTLWGAANQDHFGLLYFRPDGTGAVKTRFELRSTRDTMSGLPVISEYAQKGRKIVRSRREGGRVPCIHETQLR